MTIPAIARRTTIPREILERGIEALMLPDPESRTPAEEGRRIIPLSNGRSWGWRVVNYEKYRQIKREQDRRDYHRDYYHKRKSATFNTTQHDSTSQPIAEAKTEAKTEAETKKEKVPRKRSTAPPAPDGVTDQVWSDWLAVRKAKKAAVTDTALDIIRTEAEKAGYTLQRALETCCSRGWSGFKAAWVEDDGQRQQPRQFDKGERDRQAMALLWPDEQGDVIEGTAR